MRLYRGRALLSPVNVLMGIKSRQNGECEMDMISTLQPAKVFKYFDEISQIPRGSGNISKISDYLADFASAHRFRYRQEQCGNIIIWKDGTAGHVDSRPVMIQGHMDMVCEKISESRHDFTKEPLELNFMDDTLFARGTTLGADDGIAMAYALAVLDSDDIPHPPLEVVFTVDEETGMEGAKQLDMSVLKARRLINLDSEDEGVFYTSCAGGLRGNLTVPVSYTEHSGTKYKIVISGLNGGHSGGEIDKYNANAIILMGRLLHFIDKRMKFCISMLQGGLMDNAIPRESSCQVLVSAEDSKNFETIIADFEKTIKNEYKANEKNMMIYCDDLGECTEKVLKNRLQQRVIFLLNTIPDGIQKMCMEENTRGLVETSLNFGIMRLSENEFSLEAALRSSISSEKYALSDKLRFLTETIGGSYEEKGDYPAWEYNENSELVPLAASIYEKQTGRKPVIKGIHAGLECGIIYHALQPIDIVSFGPQINGAHTPKEQLSVSSTQRMWDLFIELLKELC